MVVKSISQQSYSKSTIPWNLYNLCLYYDFRTFSSATSDDACRDTILAHRMKQLEWVQPDHLEMSLDLRSEVVVTAIHKARQGNIYSW